MPIGLAGIDPARDETRLIGCIRKLLRLERDAVAHAVEVAALAHERPVKEVAGVELQAGLSGQNLQHAPRFRIFQSGSKLRCSGQPLIQREIMVVALSEADLFIAPVADAVGDNTGPSKIENGVYDRPALVRWNEHRIDRRICRGGNSQLVKGRAIRRPLTREVKYTMI